VSLPEDNFKGIVVSNPAYSGNIIVLWANDTFAERVCGPSPSRGARSALVIPFPPTTPWSVLSGFAVTRVLPGRAAKSGGAASRHVIRCKALKFSFHGAERAGGCPYHGWTMNQALLIRPVRYSWGFSFCQTKAKLKVM
jgi:hypothetical protein